MLLPDAMALPDVKLIVKLVELEVHEAVVAAIFTPIKQVTPLRDISEGNYKTMEGLELRGWPLVNKNVYVLDVEPI